MDWQLIGLGLGALALAAFFILYGSGFVRYSGFDPDARLLWGLLRVPGFGDSLCEPTDGDRLTTVGIMLALAGLACFANAIC